MAQTNVLTQHNDIGRTGQNLTETVLTPADVASGNFGLAGSIPIDGSAFAQPLYISSLTIGGTSHSVVFVATEHDSVFAFDASAGGQLLWKASLFDTAHGAAPGALPDPEGDTGCSNVNGQEYGITCTPVIDSTTNTMYVVSKTFENNYPVQRLHALDITTGNEKFNGPVAIQATVTGTGLGSVNGKLSFDPKWENQRTGLLLINGTVYLAWGSHCDYGPFHGWLMGYNATTLTQTTAFVTTPNGNASGIWMSGSGLAADVENGAARMYVSTGNGTYDATTPYGTNTMDYGDDILQFSLTNGLQVADAFTPSNQASLQQNDMDLSAGGVLILPDNLPGSAIAHEAVQIGKNGTLTVLNRDNLGGYSGTDRVLQEFQLTPALAFSGLYGLPAYWNGNLYLWPGQSLPNGSLLQYKITNGLLSSSPIAMSTETDTFQSDYYFGATPSISANQNTNGIVWVDDAQASFVGGAPQSFYALDAANVANTLWSSNTKARDSAGLSQKFAVPTVADGRVFLAASGQLLVYGLLDFSITPPTSISVNPGNNTVATIGLTSSNSFTQGVSFTASGLPTGVTVSFISSSSGSETAIFTASSNAVAGNSNITITSTRGTTTHSATIPLTVGGLADFVATASPASVEIGTTGYSVVTFSPQNGFTGTTRLSFASVPSGITASFAGCSTTSCTLLLAASPTLAVGTYPLTIFAASGSLSHLVSTTVTVYRSGVTSVNLSSYYNINAIVTNGTSASNGGMDGAGYALSENLLGSSLIWSGTTFGLGPANQPDAVAARTISLPAGNFVNLQFLSSDGGGLNEPFVVTYTDGSSTTFIQNLSNWGNSSGYAGESMASSTAYRVIPNGTTQNGPWYIFGYQLPLNLNKTVSTITLPPTSNVVVMGMALSSVSSAAQTILFSPISAQQAGGSFALAATATSGLTVNYSSSTTSVCSVSGSTLSLIGAGACTITASQAGNSVYAAATSVSQSFSVGAPPQVPVSLTSLYNVYGIFNSGTSPTNGGLDTAGYAFAGNLLGNSLAWGGSTFQIGQAGVADAVSSVKVTLPTGSFSSLQFLATGVFTNGASQPFVVTYSDGTTTNYTQKISDWGAPQSFPGESIALAMSYRIIPNGTTQAVVPWNLYGYSIPLNSTKTLASITLPNTRTVVVFAMTLSASSTSLTPQSIPFGSVATQKVRTALALAATASSGLAVGYISSTTSVCTVSGSTVSLIATGTCSIIASQPGNATYAPATSVTQSFTVGASSSAVQISLSSVANVYAISNVGTAPANGGLDNASYAYAGGLIGSTVNWSGTTFAIGKAGAADAVTSTKIPVPAGVFSTLKLLATASFGSQLNQQFVITYSDGTTSTYTQSVSDWGSPQSYAGESQALGMAYRVTPTGTQQAVVTWNLYGYSFPVTGGKTVVSLTLPNNRSIVVLAVSGL